VPTILLVGNHDQILRSGPSHSMSVFQSLEVPGITVIETPQIRKIKTKHGPLQVVAMPHVTRHLLMTQDKYAQMSASEIDRVLVESVSSIFADFYEQLDPKIPALSTAHMLMVGYSMTFPLDILIDSRIDYVALGHVHGHQILRREKPLIAYAGSIERVDFGEEHEDKGFLEVDIERGNATLKFHSISPRPFITVELDLTAAENPSEVLFNAAQAKVLEGAVLRLKYRIQQHRLAEIDEERVRAAMPYLLSLRFKPELVYTERPRRLPEINEKAVLQPLLALEKYLSDLAPENRDALLARARKLMEETERENS
jgi:exonuclease SbcD